METVRIALTCMTDEFWLKKSSATQFILGRQATWNFTIKFWECNFVQKKRQRSEEHRQESDFADDLSIFAL